MTDPSKYDVNVTGGKGVVVGDYATVFQTFGASPPSVASHIRTEFAALADERTRDFVGRDFVFDAIDRAVAGEEFGSGYVLVRGEPGIGKTAIASALVKRRGWVHHFNVATQNIRSPRDFLLNVCAQLVARYELDHDALAPDAGEDSGFLLRLLAEAVAKSSEPVVVVLDALDEAEDTGLPAAVNRLYLPRTLPEGAYFVLTSRPERDYRLDVDHLTEIWVREDDPQNLRDVGRFVEGFLDAHADSMPERLEAWQLGREAFVDELARLSEGNFMYLVYVLPEIAGGQLSRATVGAFTELPRGLDGYYRRHWRDMKAADEQRFERHQRPVLCFLAISREPVTSPQLMSWTGLDPGAVNGVLGEWREFLDEAHEGEAEPRWRLYHRSFAEFLDREENLRWYHERIAETALAKIPGFL